MKKRLPPRSELVARLDYDPWTGEVFWKERPVEDFSGAQNPVKAQRNWNGRCAGRLAGARCGRYSVLSLGGVRFCVHRLIWVMMTGDDPGELIDHINGDGHDNRWCNLRLASRSQNSRNRRPKAGGTSRYLGVCLYRPTGKWLAQISVDGRSRNLGYFRDEEEAARAYDRAALEVDPGYARLNFPPR